MSNFSIITCIPFLYLLIYEQKEKIVSLSINCKYSVRFYVIFAKKASLFLERNKFINYHYAF